jgi:PHD/YefM family antitoxin component YafN of YafNO toxin-antitoxin module
MPPIIKSSTELRQNYNTIAEICRTQKQPVFLTRNGAGDTVLMDIETYSRREEDLANAERLLAAQQARVSGVQGYTLEEFSQRLDEAIVRGAEHGKE